MESEEAIMILKNLLHVCEDPHQDRLTLREKKAIKKGIDALNIKEKKEK